MSPLPLPVRIAAGLVASAVEQARELPRLVVEFPVTAVSQALQASMRVQQKVTELAIKGDRALAVLQPVEEKPAWATFDDEEDVPATVNGAGIVTTLHPTRDPETHPDDLAEPPAATDEPATDPSVPDGPEELPGYPEMTIPQLRGRLRFLSADALRALLAWETAHQNRPPFVTMLSNRITSVTEG